MDDFTQQKLRRMRAISRRICVLLLLIMTKLLAFLCGAHHGSGYAAQL
jgi:hypothetical protein